MRSVRGRALVYFYLVLVSLNALSLSEQRRHYSEKLQALLAEARERSKLAIRIEVLPVEQAQQFQGRTEFRDDQIVVRIGSGYPPQHEEQIIAHELFHAILFNEGFTATYKFNRGPQVTHARLMNSAVETLNTCLTDVVIDERMASRGFSPELLARPIIKLKREQISEAVRQDPLWLRYVALYMYCSSLRKGVNPKDLEEIYEEVHATMKHRLNAIAAHFGELSVDDLDTPQKWLMATKRLRDAASFDGLIFILNRETHRWE